MPSCSQVLSSPPAPQRVLDGEPRAVLGEKIPPCTATAQHVEPAIEDTTHLH